MIFSANKFKFCDFLDFYRGLLIFFQKYLTYFIYNLINRGQIVINNYFILKNKVVVQLCVEYAQ